MPDPRTDPFGIEAGVNNFLQSYLAVSQHKQQMRLMKNAPILDLIKSQLQDENTTWDERIKLVDTIPNVLGIKLKNDVPLSQQLGIRDVAKHLVTTSSQQPNISSASRLLAGVGNNNKTTGDLATLDGSTSNVNTSVRQGDLSPFQLKLMQASQQEKNRSDLDLNRQISYFQAQAKIKAEQDNKDYKVISYEYDDKDRLFLRMANPSGDLKLINAQTNKEDKPEGNLRTEKYVTKQLTGQQLGTTFRETKQYYLNQTNPKTGVKYTDDEATDAALEDVHNNRQLIAQGTNVRNKVAENVLTGNTPLSQSQVIDDKRADEQVQIQWKNKETDLVRAQTQATTEYDAAKDDYNTSTERLTGLTSRLNSLSLLGDEKLDSQQAIQRKELQKQVDDETSNNRRLANVVRIQKGKVDGAKEALTLHRNNPPTSLGNIGGKVGPYSPSSFPNNGAGTDNYSGKKYTTNQQNKINAVRNANKEATKNMSDDEIANEIIKANKSF